MTKSGSRGVRRDRLARYILSLHQMKQGKKRLFFSTQPTIFFTKQKKYRKHTSTFCPPPTPASLRKPHNPPHPNPLNPLNNYLPPFSMVRAYMDSHVVLPSRCLQCLPADVTNQVLLNVLRPLMKVAALSRNVASAQSDVFIAAAEAVLGVFVTVVVGCSRVLVME